MEKKLLKKLLIILTVLMIISTDFVVLGTNLISYAATNNTTNNDNIEFSTYFKNEKGEKVESLTEEINSADLKLYAEIAVKQEGYFNGSIELKDANFNLKNEILSSGISKIEGNKVTLNQINAGNTVEIELGINPMISETMKLNKLNMSSTIKLTGTYMENTYKGIEIESEKQVNLNLVVDRENTNAVLETEILTNKIFSINGKNKRVVQLLVKSNLTNNNYPIKQTVIKTTIPVLGDKTAEKVEILTIGTEATNGLTTAISEDSWKNENGILEITIKNEVNENGEISWKKDVVDQFIVTFIYAEDADASKIEVKTNSEIQIHNAEGNFTAEHTVGIENKELNNIITSSINLEETEMFKGQLYANVKATEKKEIPFKTTTKIEVRSTEIADTVNVKEEKDVFVTDSAELDANTKYISTSINKDKMTKLLGENGFVEIKVGQTTYKITKDSEADESGNTVINYESEVSELEITTSKPTSAGILEINHSKVIMANSYTTEQIRTIKALKTKNTITALLGEQKVVENTAEQSKELKETTSQAELTINKQNLSTMTENKEVIIGVKLLTDETKYDLYKNPTIKIQLPQSVESIEINSFDKLYADEFEIERAVYNKVNKTIEISLKGEQTSYAVSEAAQLYLQINANITLSKTQPSKTDKITMEFTNENAIPNVIERTVLPTGTIEKEIKIVSPSGLITMNNIVNYNIEGITGTSQDKQLATVDKKTAGGTEAQLKIALVNNTQNTVNNVKILGNFPTDGEFVRGTETITNNLVTTLKSGISAQNCTIYYSPNMDATADTTDTNNGWTTNLSEVVNPKAYLIEIASMEAESNFEATYTVQLPATLEYDLTSYTGYQVLYNEGTETVVQKAQAPLVGLTTGEGIKLETTIEATVGSETLKNGDKVKNGEVIKYKITTKNNGTQNLPNVVVKGGVPTGTVLVVPEADFVYSGLSYYAEQTGVTEYTGTIPNLPAGQSYTSEYEVRVNMDTAKGTELSNKSTVSYEDVTLDSNEVTNSVEEAKVRVTVKRVLDTSVELRPNSMMEYFIIVENLSNETIDDLKIKIMLENQEVYSITDSAYKKLTLSNNESAIPSIEANKTICMKLYTKISSENINKISMAANIIQSGEKTYRSNKDIQSVETVGATIEMNSPTDGGNVDIGDEIIYNISVKNTGSVETTMLIEDVISDYLEIKEVYLDGEVKLQTTNISDLGTWVEKIGNDFSYYVTIKPNQTNNIKIVTKIKEIDDGFETQILTNSAKILINNVEKDMSEEVMHILNGNITEDNKHIVSGKAWFDKNQNGQRDFDESILPDIKVKLFDISTNTIAKDKDGKNAETTTDKDGKYTFTRINEGKYIVIFEYDMNEYELTTYMAEGVAESQNSNAILKTINIDGQDRICAVTDTINLTESVFNINIGLKELLIYDLELDKYISRIVVQNEKGTKSYDYEESTLQKVEINKKQLNNSVVILEYTIRVRNTGEIPGYVTDIKDYLPNGLEFNSELNADWYLSGKDLHTKTLSSEKIDPGQTREIKLILTKTMTDSNTGLINNRAEIIETYNAYGKPDIDSTENNEAKDEDDLGAADVIISVSTGGKIIAYVILVILNTGLIAVAIYLIFIKNKRRR